MLETVWNPSRRLNLQQEPKLEINELKAQQNKTKGTTRKVITDNKKKTPKYTEDD